MNLYQLTEDFASQIELIFDEETGELKFDIDELRGDLDAKRIAVAAYIKNLTSDYSQLIITYANMKDRADGMALKIERLKQSLLNSMRRTGSTLVNGVEFDIKVKTNPPKLVIDDEKLLPPNVFKLIPEKLEVDTGLLKQALKERPIQGAHLAQGQRIEIK